MSRQSAPAGAMQYRNAPDWAGVARPYGPDGDGRSGGGASFGPFGAVGDDSDDSSSNSSEEECQSNDYAQFTPSAYVPGRVNQSVVICRGQDWFDVDSIRELVPQCLAIFCKRPFLLLLPMSLAMLLYTWSHGLRGFFNWGGGGGYSGIGSAPSRAEIEAYVTEKIRSELVQWQSQHKNDQNMHQARMDMAINDHTREIDSQKNSIHRLQMSIETIREELGISRKNLVTLGKLEAQYGSSNEQVNRAFSYIESLEEKLKSIKGGPVPGCFGSAPQITPCMSWLFGGCNNYTQMNKEEVRIIVGDMLDQYASDRTGMVDHALESAGGMVLGTKCTETYDAMTAYIAIMGIKIWSAANSPRTAIQPDVQPGNCWAFKGQRGSLVLKLTGWIKITAFSLEHISKRLSPTGRIDSAPREFSVYGLKVLDEFATGDVLGHYIYDDNGPSIQYFPIQDTRADSYPIVELRIESNYGHPSYTCLYRFRVHGIMCPQKY